MSVLEIIGSVVGIVVGIAAISTPIARMFAKSIAEDVMRRHVEADAPHAGKLVGLGECRAEHIAANTEMRAIHAMLTEIKVQLEHLRTLIEQNGKANRPH